jgi:hypothetical protein
MVNFVIIVIMVLWYGSFLHVLFTPNARFQNIEKSKGLWIFLTFIGCLPACCVYLFSVRKKLAAVKDKQPPLKPLL